MIAITIILGFFAMLAVFFLTGVICCLVALMAIGGIIVHLIDISEISSLIKMREKHFFRSDR